MTSARPPREVNLEEAATDPREMRTAAVLAAAHKWVGGTVVIGVPDRAGVQCTATVGAQHLAWDGTTAAVGVTVLAWADGTIAVLAVVQHT
jgi:hypothetical protein